jgi:hypothetical protein
LEVSRLAFTHHWIDLNCGEKPIFMLFGRVSSLPRFHINQNDDRSALKSLRTFTPIKNDRSMEGSSFVSPLFPLGWFTSSE